ncbi:MAG: hypothetical protein V3R85_11100, partial [Alphaproteobacteria bacterium]
MAQAIRPVAANSSVDSTLRRLYPARLTLGGVFLLGGLVNKNSRPCDIDHLTTGDSVTFVTSTNAP